jgi:Vacuolar sorting protein 39 domain 2
MALSPSPVPPPPPLKDTEAAAAHLLASHATSFDPQTVLSTLPSRWPLRTLSLYLVRTLRTAAHTSHERALVKAVATGQNLAVTDAAHEQLRAAGALMEEALDEDEDEDNDVDAGVGDELVLDEKIVLPDAPASIAVDVPLGGKRERVEEVSVDAVGAVGSWMSGRSSVTHTDDRD